MYGQRTKTALILLCKRLQYYCLLTFRACIFRVGIRTGIWTGRYLITELHSCRALQSYKTRKVSFLWLIHTARDWE